jgi:hypothetical protein
MRRTAVRPLVIPGLLVILCLCSWGQILSENLRALEPMVGKTWVGELRSSDGKTASKISLRYESLWNGAVVGFRSNPTGKFFRRIFLLGQRRKEDRVLHGQ